MPAAAVAIDASRPGSVHGDAIFFVQAGRTLLSSHWSQAFATPSVQAGPLQLALFGFLGRLSSHEALAIVLATATVLLVVAAARAVGIENPTLLAGVGLLAVAAPFVRLADSTGHSADAVLPLIWILAAAEARLGGHFAMWTFQWHVEPPSPMSLVVPPGTVFGWPLRLAQAVLAVSAGVAVAYLLRRSPHASWAAPLAIVVARLQFDPLLFVYYLAGPQGPLFVGAALGASRLRLLRRMRTESYA